VRAEAATHGVLRCVQDTRQRFTVTPAQEKRLGPVTIRNRARVRRMADCAAARLGELKDYKYIDDDDLCRGPGGAFMAETIAAIERLR